jgi:RNA recognition motif-containing protein
VRFSDLQEAQAAIRGLNGLQIGGKRLLAKYAESREKAARVSPMVYVQRLPAAVNREHVAERFGTYGDIVDITAPVLDAMDPQFWTCVITYSRIEDATTAVAEMNNQIVIAGTRPIHVRFADQSRMSGSFMVRGAALQVPPLIEDEDARRLLPSFLFT